jgi:predicted acylesterase/phospholipase RssA
MTTPQTAKTVRILSLDGGGMRGYLSATFLKRFCVQAGIPANQLFNSFDIITGTSIGGVQALGYAYGKNPDEMLQFFSSKGASIFYYNSILPLSAYKLSVIMGLPTYPTTFYGQAPLRAALEEVFGTTLKLSDLPGKVIIPSWDAGEDNSTIFSNITGFEPFMTGANTGVVNVGLATSAAPLYFPSATVSGETLIDGGVYQNNPVTTAFSVARQLFPQATRLCVLSVGTGVAHNAFVPETALRSAFGSIVDEEDLKQDALMQDVRLELAKIKKKLLLKYPNQQEQINLLTNLLMTRVGSIAPYNVDYLFYLMDNVFIAGPQELNAKVMEFETQDLFDDIFNYRFQYQFLPGQDSSLDNYSTEQLTNLASYANQQYDTDALKIQNFIEHFNAG